jgi:hypothetical protein
MRCTTAPACASVVGGSVTVPVWSGEGGDLFLGSGGASFDTSTGVRYFRGACSAGAAGAPCNAAADCGTGGACAVTATTADDVTIVSWWSPLARPVDLYGGGRVLGLEGTLEAPFWVLNTGPQQAACLAGSVSGAPASGGGSNGTSGPLGQAQDPNPVVGVVRYYLASHRAQAGGGAANALGCPNPAVCSNGGWCEGGTDAGAPCNLDDDCAGGGLCRLRRTICSTDSGPADFGGCGRHGVCAGGSNAGHLCISGSECPGSTCPMPPPGVATTGPICFTLSAASLPPAPFGCPFPGDPRRLVRQAGTSSVCP